MTMGCSDSEAGALLAGGASSLAAVAFSHELGGGWASVATPPLSTAPSQNMFEQQDNLGGWIGAPALLGSLVRTCCRGVGGAEFGRVAQGPADFLHCCPDGNSGHSTHLPSNQPVALPPISDYRTLGRVLQPLGVHIWGGS